MLHQLTDPAAWVAFATLALLEIVLGIDNVIFLSILVARVPQPRQRQARLLGLTLAAVTRVALLFSIVWMTGLTRPWFQVLGQAISGRDFILIGGGLFLLANSVLEIHETLHDATAPRAPLAPPATESAQSTVSVRAAESAQSSPPARARVSLALIVMQIGLIDIVFSLDSVFTAVGMARPDQLSLMVAAILVSIVVMMWLSGPISRFVQRHPTVKILALAFLILIGVSLIGEGLDFHLPKGYLYFAMAFSVVVELINLRLRRFLDARGRASGP